MINLHELKAGNQVSFKLTVDNRVVYSTGTVTAVKENHVVIDEMILRKTDLVPILLTSDTLHTYGCTQLSAGHWQTGNLVNFEFDGIQARFNDGSILVCYLHTFQNAVQRLKKELTAGV